MMSEAGTWPAPLKAQNQNWQLSMGKETEKTKLEPM